MGTVRHEYFLNELTIIITATWFNRRPDTKKRDVSRTTFYKDQQLAGSISAKVFFLNLLEIYYFCFAHQQIALLVLSVFVLISISKIISHAVAPRTAFAFRRMRKAHVSNSLPEKNTFPQDTIWPKKRFARELNPEHCVCVTPTLFTVPKSSLV
jgi:hypothetical protein